MENTENNTDKVIKFSNYIVEKVLIDENENENVEEKICKCGSVKSKCTCTENNGESVCMFVPTQTFMTFLSESKKEKCDCDPCKCEPPCECSDKKKMKTFKDFV